jgi:hypothetical protein
VGKCLLLIPWAANFPSLSYFMENNMYQKSGFDEIRFITDKLEDMSPGQVLTVTPEPDVSITSIRQLLYSYLHYMRLKTAFKITQPSPDFLQVIRKRTMTATIKVEGKSEKAQVFVVDHLLDINNEDEALKLIRESMDKDLWIETLEEWRRICGV